MRVRPAASHLCKILIFLIVALVLSVRVIPAGTPLAWGTPFASPTWTIRHHQLTITLVPESHRLIAQDVIQLKKQQTGKTTDLVIMLNSHLTIESIQHRSQRLPFTVLPKGEARTQTTPAQDPAPPDFPSLNSIAIELPQPLASEDALTLAINYHGVIDDPPRPSPGLRYIRPDQTTGHIGPQGIYLTAETGWYPDIHGSLATYEIHTTVPPGWMVVTQGAERFREIKTDSVVSTWITRLPSEALTLSANRFVRQSRRWQDITISTYLLPEHRHLADLYLDAAVRYLAFYSSLLGPYPFPKFAIVENFFPSGIGVPSFTLLGSRIVRRGYTQPYALGHEIVHSWIGNSVLNDLSQGNWVEGLTTYLANYYYDEVHADPDRPRKHRYRMIIEYNVYAPPSEDYPLAKFLTKEHPRDNAVGYQKAALVFHMLRREVGDSAFFAGLQTLVKEHTGTYVTWAILQRLFEREAHRELGWFFAQWVTRAGAPSLSIHKTRLDRTVTDSWLLHLTIAQRSPEYRLRLPFQVALVNGETVNGTTDVFATPEYRMFLPLPERPVRLTLDPDFHLVHRLDRKQIPPLLNLWSTDSRRAVVIPQDWGREDQAAMQSLLHRIRRNPSIAIRTGDLELTSEESLLILGNPRFYRSSRQLLRGCPDHVALDSTQARIHGHRFAGEDIAVLVSCPYPRKPGHVISWFYGFTPAAAENVARLLFFYGWDSYVIFQNGRVVARDWFEPPHTASEVHWNENSAEPRPTPK